MNQQGKDPWNVVIQIEYQSSSTFIIYMQSQWAKVNKWHGVYIMKMAPHIT